MPATKKTNKNRPKNAATVATAIILTLILIPLLTFYIYPRMMAQSLEASQVSVPRVSASVISSKDGKPHTVDVSLVIEVDDKTARKLNTNELQKYAELAVARMDYEKINGEDNMNYIKSELSKELEKYVGENNLKGIYLMDVQSDQVRLADQGPSDASQRRHDLLKGFFPNME